MQTDPIITNNSTSTLVDCVIKIVGWFQISGQLNPNTNNYRPEVGSNGQPISGPGWVSYEKPGASPGDIVVIYTLQTLAINGSLPSATQLASVLWELITPGGLAYWTHHAGIKSVVSPSDIISNFPHAGGVMSPINPDNPYGQPDILWKNVTTQYQLPGPGNVNNPSLIRGVLPGFGIRVLVWTNSCCIATNLTMRPANPPTIPPTNPTPTPSPGTPIPGLPVPSVPPQVPGVPGGGSTPRGGTTPDTLEGNPNQGGGTQHSFAGIASPSSVNTTIASGDEEKMSGTAKKTPQAAKDPQPFDYTTNSLTRNIQQRVPPGMSPPQRGGSTNEQRSYVNVPLNHPFPWVNKVGDYDYHMSSRARPAGTRYISVKEGGIDARLIGRRIDWNITTTIETLNAIGLSPNYIKNGVRVQYGSKPLVVAPSGRSTEVVSADRDALENEQLNTPKKTADPADGSGGLYFNQKRSINGSYIDVQRDSSDISLLVSPRIVSTKDSQIASISKRGVVDAKKLTKTSTKGRLHSKSSGSQDIVALNRRTIDTSRAIQATRFGSAQHTILRNTGPSLLDITKVSSPPKLERIKDSSNQFEVKPILYRSGPNWAYVTIISANVSSEKEVILKQTAYIYTKNGYIAASLGNSGVITFGRVNPVMPGMYVVGNPSCLPGQGSLPNIIAGGQTWDFMVLVSTLINLEGQIITQQLTSFLPAGPTDIEVQAPNRLPVGLMRDLEITNSYNYLYDGTYAYRGSDQAYWYMNEPSIIVERSNSVANESVAIVLKSTIQSQQQENPFRPILEIYNNTNLTGAGAYANMIKGPCNAIPGWYDTSINTGYIIGGNHTACPGSLGYGGAGGSSAYIVDNFGQITSGPYNPAVYGGTHQNFLYFRYDPANPSTSDSIYIEGSSTKYRIRVHNNGPATEHNGYVLFTSGLKIPSMGYSLSILSGELQGSITTYHCNQTLKIVNDRTSQQIERQASYLDGTVTFGANTDANNRLDIMTGDTIKVYRPGFDNEYNSLSLIFEATI